MKREIKFRAWTGEQMVSPDYIDRSGKAHWKENSIPSYTEQIMQYTGLKDKHGKEIYEGDILKTDHSDNTHTLVLVRFGDCYDIMPDCGFYGWYCEFIGGNLEPKELSEVKGCQLNDSVKFTSYVYGNQYETPELLK